MANNQGNIKFGIKFDVDKTSLEQLKSSLFSLQHIDRFNLVDAKAETAELKEIQTVAQQVGAALQASFNKDLGTYNIQTFKNNLASSNLSIAQIGQSFTKAGEQGKIAFRNMISTISSTKIELKETHNILDKMSSTLSNTIRWSIASSAINSVTGSIQKAWSFTKQLDSSLNDIMIVTGKSADEMDKFAIKANNAAKALGSTTKSYTDAALIYYQQGLSDEDVAARSETTVKVANVTGQNAHAVSEQLTAVWNGYKVSANEAETYIDKLSAVAATTAADLEELSTGISRVASAANIMGVDVDQLNAQLATIVSVTREAPESIGTALKTVYARMSDIEAGIDSETTLGEYTTQMAEMGINVLTAQGNLRDMGDVVEEIGNKWNSLNREQQVSLAQSIAGTRQYSRMMALFDNWDMYQEALATSQNSIGTLQSQQETYMESLEGHLNQLTASTERLYSKLFDSDSFKTLIDMISGIVDGIGTFVQSIGGGGALLASLIPLLTSMFSKNISQGIATTATNFINAKENAESLQNALINVRTAITEIGNENIDGVSKQFLNLQENLINLRKAGLITDEQFKELGKDLEKTLNFANQASAIKAERESIDKQMRDTEPVGDNITLEQIQSAAEKGDQDSAKQLAKNYSADILTRESNFAEAVETPLEINEDASYTEKMQAIQEYLAVVQDAANQTGLLSQKEQEDLQAEIDAINRKKEAQEESLRQLQEQEGQYSSKGETISQEEQAQLDKIRAEIAKVQQEMTRTANTAQKSVEKIVNKTSKSVQEGSEKARKAAKTAASGIESELNQKTKQAATAVTKNLNKINITGVINQFVQIVSVAGQVFAAFNTLSNIKNIYNDENLTSGEKLIQIFTTILSTCLVLIPSISTLIKTLYAKATAMVADAAASKVAAGGTLTFGAALWSLLWPVLAVVAAIAALVAIIFLISKALDAKADAAKAASESAQGLADSYKAAKKAADELRKSLEEYDKTQDTLDKMVKGTKEWEEALQQANAQVLELIEKYPQLINYVERTSDGRLTISEEGKEKVLQKANESVSTAGLMKTLGQVRAMGKQFEYDIETLNDEENIQYKNANGDVYGISDTRLEGIVKKLAEANLTISGRTSEEIKTLFQDELNMQIDDTLAKSLDQASEKIDALSLNLEQNTDALRLQFEETAKNYYESQGYDLGPNAEAVTRALSTEFTEDEIEKKQDDLDWDHDDDWFHEQYAEYMVETGQWQSYQSINDEAGEAEFTYIDAEGNQQSAVTIDDDQTFAAVASYELMKESGASLPAVVAAVQELAALSGGNEELSFALTNLSGNQGEKVDLSGLTEQELESFKNTDLSNVDYKSLGYDSLEELEKTRDASVQAYNTALETLADSVSDSAKDHFNELFTHEEIGDHVKSLTLKQKQEFAKLYEKMFDATGEEGLEAFNQVLISAGDKSDELINFITTETFDWSSEDIQEQVQAKLEEANIQLPEGFNFDGLIQSMQELNNIDTGFNLEKTQATLSKVEKIIGSLSKQGDTISAEDYDSLTDEAKNYFTQMADGTYMLTTSVKAFSKALKEYQINKSIEELSKEKESLEKQIASKKTVDSFKTIGDFSITKTAEEAYKDAYSKYFSENKGNNEDANKKVIKDWLKGNSSSAAAFKSNANNKLAEGKTFDTLTDDEWEEYIDERFYQLGGNTVEIDDDYEFYSNGHRITQLDFNDTNTDGIDILKEVAAERGTAANQVAVGAQGTNNAATGNLKANLSLLKTLDIETLKNMGLTPSEIDTYINEVQAIIDKGGALTAEDVSKLDEISGIFQNISLNDVDTTSFTTGVVNTLKQASSSEELAAIKSQIAESFGYTITDIVADSSDPIAKALYAAFEDSSVSLVVAENYMQEMLELYNSQLTQLDKINEAYEHANLLLEHQRNLIELITDEKNFLKLNGYYQSSIETINKQLSFSATNVSYWQDEMNRALAAGQVELYETAKANWESATDSYYNNMSKKIELLKEQYLNSINVIFDEQEKLWGNGKSLDYINNQWDMMQKRSEQYLDPVNAVFEKQKLENKFTSAINEATSINAQKKLKTLMEDELDLLENKDKLSEYDLKRAEARLEVEKAQLALEEARANKSKMRLTRGADGTYSYQYVADVDNITKAQEALAQAQQDLYNLDVDEYKNNLEMALDLYQDYKERMLEISQIADEDERNIQLQLLKEEYLGEDGLLTNLLGDNESIKNNLTASFGDSMALLGEDFGTLGDAVDATVSSLAEFVENMDFESLEVELLKLQTPWEDISSATLEWNTALEESLGIVENIASAMEKVYKTIGVADPELFAETVAAEITGSMGETSVWTSGGRKNVSLGDIIDVTNQANTADVHWLASDMGGKTYQIKNRNDFEQYLVSYGLVQQTATGETYANPSNKLKEWFAKNGGSSQDKTFEDFMKHIRDDEYIWRDNYLILVQLLNDIDKAGGIESLDTGGYTGSWDYSGKLAFLHEKELVLNQNDTRNILKTVDLVRSLQNTLSTMMFDNILAQTESLYQRELADIERDMAIEQNVHITAEFPNAEDRDEIREAFEEIINLAAQKTLENKRG